jgi:hypothetical protein
MGNLFGRALSIQGVARTKTCSEREFSSGGVFSPERYRFKVKTDTTDTD